jgi:hypothetical protein
MKERLDKIYQEIQKACQKCGRDPKEVVLIGVTKYTDLAKVQQAIDAGLAHIAENRVQDAQERFPLLKFAPGQVTKHLIGHLQTNKAKFAVPLFDMIQSVDSLKLVEEIQKQAQKHNKVMDIFQWERCLERSIRCFDQPLAFCFPIKLMWIMLSQPSKPCFTFKSRTIYTRRMVHSNAANKFRKFNGSSLCIRF